MSTVSNISIYQRPLAVEFSRSGLTLVELLVVLTILAVVSTIALRSVAQLTEETRFEANLTQIESIESAVLGENSITGFIGDIGRLPVAVDPGSMMPLQPSELWKIESLPSYSIQTPPGDSEVRLGGGWRGPYLDLGFGQSELVDGYGKDFLFFEADGDPSADGETIAIIQSLGVDQMTGGDGVNADTAAVFEADSNAVLAGLSASEQSSTEDIVVTLVRPNSQNFSDGRGNVLLARVYGPSYAADGTGGVVTIQQAKFEFDDPVDNPGTPSSVISVTLTLADLPFGPKVFRAYQIDGPVPGNEEDLTAVSATATERISPATNVTLEGRTDPVTLTLRNF
ncbi:MAG: prepilin-type N-terminal cleavage/methylation domain-containing protein [Verrucomicrobiota bacterium]